MVKLSLTSLAFLIFAFAGTAGFATALGAVDGVSAALFALLPGVASATAALALATGDLLRAGAGFGLAVARVALDAAIAFTGGFLVAALFAMNRLLIN